MTNPLGTFLIIFTIFSFSSPFYYFLSIFSFSFIFGALIFLSYLLSYSYFLSLHCSLFSPFIIFVNFSIFPFLVFLFQFIMSILFPLPLWTFPILFPFSLSLLFHFSFCFYYSFLSSLILLQWLRKGLLVLVLFLCWFALFCQHLYNNIQQVVEI